MNRRNKQYLLFGCIILALGIGSWFIQKDAPLNFERFFQLLAKSDAGNVSPEEMIIETDRIINYKGKLTYPSQRVYAYVAKGKALIEQKKYEEAIESAKAALASPAFTILSYQTCYHILAESYRALGRFSEAADAYQKLIDHAPEEIYIKQLWLVQAEAVCAAAQQVLEEKMSERYKGMLSIEELLQAFNQAILTATTQERELDAELRDEAKTTHTLLLFAYTEKARLLMTEGRKVEAREAITKAISFDPADFRLKMIFAATYIDENWDEAIRIIERAAANATTEEERTLILGIRDTLLNKE